MKQRVISGTIVCLITILAVVCGGYVFKVLMALIALYGTYELVKVKAKKFNSLEYIIMLILVLLIGFSKNKALAFLLLGLVSLLSYAVFSKHFTFVEACVSFLEVVLLGFGINQLLEVEFTNKLLLAYLIIIAYLTDVAALFVGMKFGKRKLNERVSPKKTIEGFLGGWAIGFIVSFLFALCCNFFDLGVLVILLLSIILPLVSQIGDLIFSLIKRHFAIKDFSNLIPGHGGLLDRLDSMLIILLVFKAILILIN